MNDIVALPELGSSRRDNPMTTHADG